MNIFFPIIGTKLKLLQDWEFPLYSERRNESVSRVCGYKSDDDFPYKKNPTADWPWLQEPYAIIIMPAETVLKVDRIYIRKGCEDFNSITFNVVSSPDGSFFYGKKKLRFWAKIGDINDKMNAIVVD